MVKICAILGETMNKVTAALSQICANDEPSQAKAAWRSINRKDLSPNDLSGIIISTKSQQCRNGAWKELVSRKIGVRQELERLCYLCYLDFSDTDCAERAAREMLARYKSDIWAAEHVFAHCENEAIKTAAFERCFVIFKEDKTIKVTTIYLILRDLIKSAVNPEQYQRAWQKLKLHILELPIYDVLSTLDYLLFWKGELKKQIWDFVNQNNLRDQMIKFINRPRRSGRLVF